jgi:hypothetical protein
VVPLLFQCGSSMWCGVNLISLWFHCCPIVVPVWFHCGSTVALLWFHCGSTVLPLWFHCGSTVVQLKYHVVQQCSIWFYCGSIWFQVVNAVVPMLIRSGSVGLRIVIQLFFVPCPPPQIFPLHTLPSHKSFRIIARYFCTKI